MQYFHSVILILVQYTSGKCVSSPDPKSPDRIDGVCGPSGAGTALVTAPFS